MLQNDFYSVLEKELTPNGIGIEARIRFDRSHRIFTGHFPQVPVVPGVCLIQMVQELSGELLDKKLTLANGSNIKFLAPINPDMHPEVHVSIQTKINEDQMVKVSAVCSFDSLIFMKLRAGFKL